jgi:hypothetical protein
MGSFVELNLAFTFAPETPEYVLGAFRDWKTGEEAPELSSVFESSLEDDGFDADLYLANYGGEEADLMGPLSLLQRAAMWRYLMSWDTVYRAALGSIRRTLVAHNANAPQGMGTARAGNRRAAR